MSKLKFLKSKSGGGNPFQNIDKTSVLQETRTFNDTPVNARKCTHILTKILYLINQVCIKLTAYLLMCKYSWCNLKLVQST